MPSDREEDSIADEIPSVSDNSESDSGTEWEIIENGTEKGNLNL